MSVDIYPKMKKMQSTIISAAYTHIENLPSTHQMCIEHIKNVVYHMTKCRTNQKQLTVEKQLTVVPCDQ